MPFDPPNGSGTLRHYAPCPVCAEHPGWAHDDESARSEPTDVCAACLGSGRIYDLSDIDVDRILAQIARGVNYARAALADEGERDFRLSVKRMANRTAALTFLTESW